MALKSSWRKDVAVIAWRDGEDE